ncbi:MAG TPA: polymorphic toxin-type HINT domain-containing protein, partial [Rugosimonospora sp.]|nr:polymorphic toxin-type HINT domain-containing protein [Rugosimonospora sp.]
HAASRSASNAAASAVWAQASAQHAATLALDAYGSYQRAYASARAAGQDYNAALAAAKQARDAAQADFKAEQATWAYEQSAKCDGPLVDRDQCIQNIIRTVQNPLLTMYINGGLCQLLYNPNNSASNPDHKGPDAYRDCINDVLSPTFGDDQALEITDMLLRLATQLEMVVLDAEVLLGTVEFCGTICGSLLETAAPLLMPELIGLPTIGADLFAGGVVDAGLTALLEETAEEARANEAALARMAEQLQFGCPANSFAADTPVLLTGGTSKPIQDVRLGDRVLSTDPLTGATGAEPVTSLITGTGDKQLVDVTIRGARSAVTVTATANHPFWVPDLAVWVDAGTLRAGQLLRTSNGAWAQVTAVRQRTAHATVYNLAVAGYHTYYVRAVGTAVLVHNESTCDLALGLISEGLQSWAERNGYLHFVGPEWRQNEWDWMGPVLGHILNPATTLRVRLDGFTGANSEDMFVKAALNGAKNRTNGSGTELEMAWIARAVYLGQRDWASVKFYRGGAPVEIALPDWWNLVTGDSADAKALRDTWQKFLDIERWARENGKA